MEVLLCLTTLDTYNSEDSITPPHCWYLTYLLIKPYMGYEQPNKYSPCWAYWHHHSCDKTNKEEHYRQKCPYLYRLPTSIIIPGQTTYNFKTNTNVIIG